MKQTFFEHHLNHTGREDMIKITSFLEEDLRISGIRDGIAVIHSPHTTAGITVNENADPDVVHDMLFGLDKVYPLHDKNYRHAEGNSNAHLKTSTVGPHRQSSSLTENRYSESGRTSTSANSTDPETGDST